MLPIPKNLKKIIEPIGEKNTEFRLYGDLICICKNRVFEILYVGDNTNYNKDKIIELDEIDGEFYLIVKSKCKKCNTIHDLFDMDYHGWNGFVCEGFGARSNPRPKDKKWCCIDCKETEHKIRIKIYSQGKQDFILETEGEFPEDEWVEGYSWIEFEIECVNCGLKNQEWTSYETM